MTLSFNKETHTYMYDNVKVPSVTTILKPIVDFSKVPVHTLELASRFGTAVHLACEYDDKGTLKEDELSDSLKPYLNAWRKFSADHKVKWDKIEDIVFDKKLFYAGCPDRLGRVKGISTTVDIKSCFELHPSVGPQLAAYQKASTVKTLQRMAVLLRADGTYETKTYSDPNDWGIFCNLLASYPWCKSHNLELKIEGASHE